MLAILSPAKNMHRVPTPPHATPYVFAADRNPRSIDEALCAVSTGERSEGQPTACAACIYGYPRLECVYPRLSRAPQLSRTCLQRS